MKINCPHCSASLEAGPSAIGQTVNCPECGNPFGVPVPVATSTGQDPRRLAVLQSKLKSPGIALLLALLFPYIGLAYASAELLMAYLIPWVLAAVLIMANFEDGGIFFGVGWLLNFLCWISSAALAHETVKKQNKKIVRKMRGA